MKMKLPELRAIAKERGLRGFSRMKKADLVNLLSSSAVPITNISEEPLPAITNILDEPLPEINVRPLSPTAAKKPKLYDRTKKSLQAQRIKVRSELNSFAN